MGLELIDSDILSALDDIRKDGIGDVRISNTVVYAKVFVGDSFYLVGIANNVDWEYMIPATYTGEGRCE